MAEATVATLLARIGTAGDAPVPGPCQLVVPGRLVVRASARVPPGWRPD
jgi:hypothetical protein